MNEMSISDPQCGLRSGLVDHGVATYKVGTRVYILVGERVQLSVFTVEMFVGRRQSAAAAGLPERPQGPT